MRDEIAVRKMIDHAERVIAYCEGYSYEDFLTDTRTIEASVFNISQIGELAHLLEKTYGKQFPNVPWHDMYGVRCRIIHDYDGVNFALAWQIIRNDLPKLLKDLNEILKK